MPRRALTSIALAISMLAWVQRPALAEGGGAIGGGGTEVISWVFANEPGGNIQPPSPGVECAPWKQVTELPPGTAADLLTLRADAAGLVWRLYYRDCGGPVQFAWVPVLNPAQLGQFAFDELVKRLPKPAPSLSPDAAVGGYVNVETWLAVTDPRVVTATSAIPGLSATATARVTRIEWQPGDGSTELCQPFGSLPPSPGFTGRAPCGHTYVVPSHPKVTGTADERFHGSVTLVWSVTWTASNGASGSLGEARSVSPFVYRVREIQTIGSGG